MPAGVAVRLLLCGTLFLAGCLGPAAAGPPGNPPDPAPPLPGYAYGCPPGGGVQGRAGVCVASLPSEFETGIRVFERDPARPERVVVGLIRSFSPSGLHPQHPEGPVDVVSVHAYTSADAGRSWRAAELPYVPARAERPLGQVRQVGLTDGLFDATGAVHLLGYSDNAKAEQLALGSAPAPDAFVLRGAPEADPWGPVRYVTGDARSISGFAARAPDGELLAAVTGAFRDAGKAHLVASIDHGASWAPASQALPDCQRITRPVFVGPRTLFACSVGNGEDSACAYGARVHELDRTRRSARVVGFAPCTNSFFPHLLALPNGTLVMAAAERVFWSHDEGASWRGGFDVRDRSGFAGDWGVFDWVVARLDPWGGLHLLLAGTYDCLGPVTCKSNLGHFVFDPRSMELVHESPLLPDGATGASPDVGLAFGREDGLVMWPRAQTLEYTVVRPVWPT